MRQENPCAFPSANSANLGMSLRDHFAAKALQGLLSQTYDAVEGEPSQAPYYDLTANTEGVAARLARHAYAVADAMLAQREPDPDAS